MLQSLINGKNSSKWRPLGHRPFSEWSQSVNPLTATLRESHVMKSRSSAATTTWLSRSSVNALGRQYGTREVINTFPSHSRDNKQLLPIDQWPSWLQNLVLVFFFLTWQSQVIKFKMADRQGVSRFCPAFSLSEACEEVMRIQIVMMRTLGKAFLFFVMNTPISFDFLDCFIHVSASACSNGVNFVQKCKKKI